METILISEVKVREGRFRKDFGDVEDLAASIAKCKQIQPIVLDEDNYLIAGERRLRAHMLLGRTEIGYVRMDGLTELERREIEIEENIRRKPFNWPEEVLALEELYKLKVEIYGKSIQGGTGGYGLKEASGELKMSVGSIHADLELAAALHEFPEIVDEPTKTGAMRRYKRLRSHKIRQALAAKQAVKKDDFVSQIAAAPAKAATDPEQAIQAPGVRVKRAYFEGHGVIFNGDSRMILRRMEDKSVDVIVTDPPYGLGLYKEGEAMSGKRLAAQQGAMYDDDPYKLVELLNDVFSECYRLLKPGGHVYCFFHHAWYEEIYEVLNRAFLNLNDSKRFDATPCVWIKNTSGIGDPNERWCPAYEPFFFCNTGRSLVKPQPFNYIQCDTVPAKKKRHPTEKPALLLRRMIEASAVKGEVVLDPFAGSGSTLVGAIQAGCRFMGIELHPDFYEIAKDSVALAIGEIEEQGVKQEEIDGDDAPNDS